VGKVGVGKAWLRQAGCELGAVGVFPVNSSGYSWQLWTSRLMISTSQLTCCENLCYDVEVNH
jgi:hypothetical protein